ncbi:unnamed protein product [Prunus armeniaca]
MDFIVGVDAFNDPKLSLVDALNDTHRIDHYNRHLYYVQSAIENGVKVKGILSMVTHIWNGILDPV